MYENQFIQFTQAIDPLDRCMPLPVVFGGDGIACFVPTSNKDAVFTLVDAEGNPFMVSGNALTGKFRSLAGNYAAQMFADTPAHAIGSRLRNAIFDASMARNYVAPNECFRIKIHSEETLASLSSFTHAVDASTIVGGTHVVRTIAVEGLTDVTFAAGTYTLDFSQVYIRMWKSNGVPYQQWANIKIYAGSTMIFNQSAYWYPVDDVEKTFTASSSFQISIEIDFGYYDGGRTSGDAFTFEFSKAVLKEATGTDYYSNLLRRYENPNGELSLLSYTCDTTTFDLPFTSARPIRQWLPIWLNKPKYNQKDEIYEKLSGERVVLFATINKELSAQTDYIPDEWHQRMVMALSCDNVQVNGVRLTKSDNYDIYWDNHTESDCGVWIARATWKMVANVTSRNSNN